MFGSSISTWFGIVCIFTNLFHVCPWSSNKQWGTKQDCCTSPNRIERRSPRDLDQLKKIKKSPCQNCGDANTVGTQLPQLLKETHQFSLHRMERATAMPRKTWTPSVLSWVRIPHPRLCRLRWRWNQPRWMSLRYLHFSHHPWGLPPYRAIECRMAGDSLFICSLLGRSLRLTLDSSNVSQRKMRATNLIDLICFFFFVVVWTQTQTHLV